MTCFRKKISRRSFLTLLAASFGGLVVFGSGLGRFFYLGNDCGPFVAAVVRQRLTYLTVSAKDLENFANDFQNRRIDANNRKLWVLLAAFSPFHPLLDAVVRLTPRARAYEELCDAIERSFLISSDFFFHQGDESRTVHYIGYYDPWKRPCSNPFANLALD